jgi:hypothetical protein
VRHRGELTDKRAAVVARLVDLHQYKLELEVDQTMAMEQVEGQLPAFARASQNVAAAAALLDALLLPSTDGVGEMYQLQKSILSTAIAPQAKSSLQHWIEASILTPAHPKDGGQRASQQALDTGMASSLAGYSAYDHLSHPSARLEPQVG